MGDDEKKALAAARALREAFANSAPPVLAWVECESCDGTGTARVHDLPDIRCHVCDGTGRVEDFSS